MQINEEQTTNLVGPYGKLKSFSKFLPVFKKTKLRYQIQNSALSFNKFTKQSN